ncbi:MAG: PBP1A family penicillin-binding protein [Alphaproteobacteria bacterium]|nr:PBP1A family penicillin-binding protein [Alphaproteobacteria bacterium]
MDLPDVHEVSRPPLRPSVELESDDGTVFARYGNLVGRPVVASHLPARITQAIIAVEDRRFYRHFGIDLWSIFRAAAKNILAGHTVQGGSTLTQQLAKNLFLTPQRTLKRKVQEMILAVWLERTYTKNEILTAYLNRVYLGSGAYGLDAAAQTYFGKHAKDLTLPEAALIAGLLRAPSRYSPLHDPAQALERSKIVLQAMLNESYITKDEYTRAIANPPTIEIVRDGSPQARYFADWVYDELGPFIVDTQQDLVVRTTLDLTLEKIAEKDVEAILSKQGKARKVTQAALITLAPDGGVKAMTGGRDYNQSQFNRATQALRQPGSAFKPIVYLAAIEKGLLPDDILIDEPVTIGRYSPANYDDKYLGPVTAQRALAESINSVAVKVLSRAGLDNVIKTARNLGIVSPLERNATLALGASEVTPLELSAAYASIASGGRAITPYGIKEIRTRSGDLLFRYDDATPPRVLSADSVATLTRMMVDVIKTGTGRTAALGTRPVAGKTGTTSDYRDAWFAGFTADYTTVIWMGNDDNEPTKKVTGSSLPALLWHNYMKEAESQLPEKPLRSGSLVEQFFEGAGAVTNDVSKALGDFIDSILGR